MIVDRLIVFRMTGALSTMYGKNVDRKGKIRLLNVNAVFVVKH